MIENSPRPVGRKEAQIFAKTEPSDPSDFLRVLRLFAANKIVERAERSVADR